jgi:hypothetical protein
MDVLLAAADFHLWRAELELMIGNKVCNLLSTQLPA